MIIKKRRTLNCTVGITGIQARRAISIEEQQGNGKPLTWRVVVHKPKNIQRTELQ